MSARIKRKQRMSFWTDKTDLDVLEATSENFRIDVDRAFQEFISDSSLKEHSFPSTLNNFERKHIHQKAATFNLLSRSHGKDPNRILTIYKKRNKSNFESFYIDLADLSKYELRKIRHCTCEGLARHVAKLPQNDKVFGKLSLGEPPLVRAPNVTPQIQTFQRQLPIYPMKDLVVEKVRNNAVVIVSSETGSGKTTQIPQYIMEDARQRGEKCKILCTQPRRISAVSVAERVSQERGFEVGEAVGYHIRLESKLGLNCNLVYCTNGVLIRSLMAGDRVLASATHIIIDEVHERDKLSDFLLICLRESLRKNAKIKLILMSATINVEKFQTYFEGAEVLSVPGRLFPIKELFLDEILEMTGYDQVLMEKKNFFSENSVFNESPPNPHFDDIIMRCFHTRSTENDEAWSQLLQYILAEEMPINYQHSQSGMTSLIAAVFQDNVDVVEKLCNLGADPKIVAKKNYTALSIAEDKGNEDIILLLNMFARPFLPREDLLTHYYKTVADEDINYELLTRLICAIHKEHREGAILVFLPGYDDIMMCHEYILNANLDTSTYRVFFLHGSMNIKEQHEVFKSLNVRKIILSTNIAETSLTIDDVVYVIDSGKAKVQTYDSCSGLSSLQVQWISKACVKQRAGRAGRTQSGMCFHLFSKLRYESFLDERIPEILRVPLEELCLNTKTLAGNLSSIYNFLVMAPDPPSSNTVKTAIENLECLGALDKDENLTPLGEYLSQLTIEPHLGKMLIYSVIFKCLDPVLTIVASLAQKDPFQLPPQANLRSFAAEKRRLLTANTFSDHMVYLKAFIKWQDAVKCRKERLFCKDFFISSSTMETILKTRSQLLGQLRAAKFVPPNGNSMIALNHFSENWPMVKAVISAGLYPKLAFKKNAHFCTRTEKKVLIHNSSPLSKEQVNLWLVYDEMVKVRNGHQVRGVTPVTPITISLMCGVKTTTSQENYLEIDEWLEFEFPDPSIVNLRKITENIIEKKLYSPANSLSSNEELVLETLASILITEDRSANMVIPTGIKHKPKFFEMTRSYESFMSRTRDCYDTSREVPTVGRVNDAVVPIGAGGFPVASPSNCDYRNLSAPPPNYYPMRYNCDNGFNPMNENSRHFSNGYSEPPSNGFSYNPSPVNGRNYSGPPRISNGISTNNVSFPNSYGNQNFLEGATGGGASPQFSLLKAIESQPSSSKELFHDNRPFMNTVFILIRVRQENSVKIAHETNKWVFAPQTERQIVSLDNGGVTVFLLYTVHKMNTFYGIAKFVGMDRQRHKPSAAIEWKFKGCLPYRRVSHLRNPLNNNRLIYDGIDGQIIENEVAIKLWEMYVEEQRRARINL